jgi:hypothetical protein
MPRLKTSTALCVTCGKKALLTKKQCRSCYKKAYRLANHAKLLEQERAQHFYNRPSRLKAYEKFRYSPKARFKYMTRDAAKRGLSCTLPLEQYVSLIANNCYYCECPMPRSMGTGLDRIDNSKGYDMGNVLTCCGDCNLLRMHKLTVKETKLLSMTLKAFRENKSAKKFDD